ncbi:MAG: DEAD/DEAH box helicase [Deltaproteobacteria bacterium]|nr:DEAD/DEAH box helicase [Deltaproteobacteria bacterium]
MHGPHPAPSANSAPNVAPMSGMPGQQLQAQQSVPMTTLAQRSQRHFPGRARALGHDYFLSGRVSEPTRVEDTFTLQVLGSGPSYNVVLDFSKTPADKSMDALCDCPYYDGGGLCKHLWAAILQIDKAGLASVVPETGQLRVVHARPRNRRDGRNGASNGKLPAMLPNPNGQVRIPSLPGVPAVSSWRARLDQIQGVTGGRPANTFAGTWLAYFVVSASETVSSGKLVIDLWTRDRLSNGGLGPLKPNRLPSHDVSRFTDVRDQEVLSILDRTGEAKTFAPHGRGAGNPSSRFTVDPILETQLIPTLTNTGKLFLSRSPTGSPDDADRPLRMDRGKPWNLELKIEAVKDTHYRIDGILKRDNETRGLNEPLWIFGSSFMLFADRICKLSDPRQVAWAKALKSPEPFLVPRDQGDALLRRILADPAVPKVTWPDDMGWKTLTIDPKPKGVFRPLGIASATGRMTLTVSFDYAGREISLNDTAETLVDVEQKCVYTRNVAFEEGTLTQALKILRDDQGTGTLPTAEMHRVAAELTASGWTVYIENQRLHVADDFAMNVSTNTDWFDIKMEASFGNAAVGQPALLAALAAKDGLVKLADGSLGMLPKEWLERYASMSEFGEKNDDGSLRFTKSQGLMLNAALAETDHVRADLGFTSFRERVAKFEGVKMGKAPKGFVGTLRDYQKEGLAWLGFVEEFQMGGILADDMGLGKTIQILAFLRGREKSRNLPSIVVAPKSLVFNWQDEAARFVPDLNVISYSGAGRSKFLKDIPTADLVVTTYGTLRTDIDKLREFEFDVAIVDEAQAIKNANSQSAQACKRLRANQRLALTGTPIENSLTDLFSILEFTSPGLLTMTQDQQVGEDTAKMLSRMLKPFALRRTKEKVLKELPEKSEQVLFCEMSTTEKQYYNTLRDHYRATLTGETDGGKSNFHVLEALLRLRQASCHPGLVNPELRGEGSAKLSLLLSQIKEVIEEGHKALVFSQFTSLLSLVREDFDREGITYEYLDGQTMDRKTPVERFQTDKKCPVFLISLKAGGTGLNLTAADYVFILDPWWNPAVEAQAIGRAHRIGQSNKVFAYRMIARGTVEEKIVELQKTKRELAESIFSEDKEFMGKLTREDLEQLLS